MGGSAFPGGWHCIRVSNIEGTHGPGKTGKTGKMAKKSLSGKTQGNWKFCQNTGKTQGILSKQRENTGKFVSSSCKCSDSKSKGYCDSCR